MPSVPTGGTTSTIKNISGYIQKGPFTIGSSITAFDLNNNLSPTGRTYNTQTDDNNASLDLTK